MQPASPGKSPGAPRHRLNTDAACGCWVVGTTAQEQHTSRQQPESPLGASTSTAARCSQSSR